MNSGLYQLIVSLPGPIELSPGRLGTFRLPRGNYVYTGSARKNLSARLARHARKEKKVRWHVDYLLQYGIIKANLIYPLEMFTECELNRLSRELLGGDIPITHFGASDCRCGGHLIRCPGRYGVREIEKVIGQLYVTQ